MGPTWRKGERIPKIRCKNAEIGVFLGKNGKPQKSKAGGHNILKESCQRLRGFNPAGCEGCKIQVPGTSAEVIRFSLPEDGKKKRFVSSLPDGSNGAYILAREVLIDEAVRFANEEMKKLDLPRKIGNHGERNMAWNQFFHTRMVVLAEEKGLTKPGLKSAFRVQEMFKIRGFNLMVKDIKENEIHMEVKGR